MIIMVSHGFPSVVEPLVTFHVLFWRAIMHGMTCLHSKMDSRYLWRLSSVESPVDHLPPACERHKHLWRHHEANLSEIWNYSACITLSQPYLFLPAHPKDAQRMPILVAQHTSYLQSTWQPPPSARGSPWLDTRKTWHRPERCVMAVPLHVWSDPEKYLNG